MEAKGILGWWVGCGEEVRVKLETRASLMSASLRFNRTRGVHAESREMPLVFDVEPDDVKVTES